LVNSVNFIEQTNPPHDPLFKTTVHCTFTKAQNTTDLKLGVTVNHKLTSDIRWQLLSSSQYQADFQYFICQMRATNVVTWLQQGCWKAKDRSFANQMDRKLSRVSRKCQINYILFIIFFIYLYYFKYGNKYYLQTNKGGLITCLNYSNIDTKMRFLKVTATLPCAFLCLM
jgi:hypothetical protein